MKRKAIIIPRIVLPLEIYGYIYITTNTVNNKQYVGQHKLNTTEGNYKGSGTILLKAFNKYGKYKFNCEFIDIAYSFEELNQKEIWWIDFLEAVSGESWYNISLGGNGVPHPMFGKDNPNYGKHLKHTEEQKEKMKHNAKVNPDFGMKGKKHSDKARKKMSENHADCSGSNHPMYGVHRYGKDNPNYENHKIAGSSHPKATPIVMLTFEYKLVQEFSYMNEAKSYGFVNTDDISRCCRGKKSQYKGYLWMYKKDYITMIEEKGGNFNGIESYTRI